MLARDLLQIKKNPANGVIEFLYLYNPQEQEDDRLKFAILVQAILHELKLFKNEHKITDDCNTLGYDLTGQMNSLRISFVNPRHYDLFILLFAPQNKEQQDKRNMLSQRQVDRLLYPLSTRLTPANSNNSSAQTEEEKEQEYYSPLRPLHPAERLRQLRPRGY